MEKTSRLSTKITGWHYDVRVIQRSLNEGRVTPDQHKVFLETLPDVIEKSQPFETLKENVEEPESVSVNEDEEDTDPSSEEETEEQLVVANESEP